MASSLSGASSAHESLSDLATFNPGLAVARAAVPQGTRLEDRPRISRSRADPPRVSDLFAKLAVRNEQGQDYGFSWKLRRASPPAQASIKALEFVPTGASQPRVSVPGSSSALRSTKAILAEQRSRATTASERFRRSALPLGVDARQHAIHAGSATEAGKILGNSMDVRVAPPEKSRESRENRGPIIADRQRDAPEIFLGDLHEVEKRLKGRCG